MVEWGREGGSGLWQRRLRGGVEVKKGSGVGVSERVREWVEG